MDAKVRSLNWALKRIDSTLFALRSEDGVIHVARDKSLPKHLFSLTETWGMNAKPVDWGIQPVIDHYREGDPETQGLQVPKLHKQRERQQELKERALRNDLRAKAMDLRREFAKATNDINTSIVEKVENRRKHGHL